MEATVDHGEIKEKTSFVFTLSPDQEKVSLKIVVGETVMDSGTYTYNYVLLMLAQQRQQDIKAAMHPKTRAGWT